MKKICKIGALVLSFVMALSTLLIFMGAGCEINPNPAPNPTPLPICCYDECECEGDCDDNDCECDTSNNGNNNDIDGYHTIRFLNYDGSIFYVLPIAKGQTITADNMPHEPTRAGYRFWVWTYGGGVPITPIGIPILNDMTFEPLFHSGLMIRLYMSYGDFWSRFFFDYGQPIDAELLYTIAEFMRPTGHRLAGWYFKTDTLAGEKWEAPFDINQAITGDISLVARFEWAARTFVVLPTHTQFFRDLDPDCFEYDALIDSLTDNEARNALRRFYVGADGYIRRELLNLIAYRRPGFQIVGFYSDMQFRIPLAFNEEGLFRPDDCEYGLVVRIFIRYIDENYRIIRSKSDLFSPFDNIFQIGFVGHNYYFTDDIDFGGAELVFAPRFHRTIRGNRHVLSNFVTSDFVSHHNNNSVSVLFNLLSRNANIINISFLDVRFIVNTSEEALTSRLIINAFAFMAYDTARVNNVLIEFSWTIAPSVALVLNNGWWDFAWEDGVSRSRYEYFSDFNWIGGVILSGFRVLDICDYASNPLFSQVGANFGGYFKGFNGLYGGENNALNNRAVNLGEIEFVPPLHLGVTIDEHTDFSVFDYEFEGFRFGGVHQHNFEGWFVFDKDSITFNMIHFRLFDPLVDYQIGTFVVPLWRI